MVQLYLGTLVYSFLFVLLVCIAAGLYRTRKVERSPNQAKFHSGHLPKPLPSGPYKGSAFTGLGKNWKGKVFDRSVATGINQFTDGQRYRFSTYPAPGLHDPDIQTLMIDYNRAGNPWWLRLVVDEIVQVGHGHYLGKVHIKLLPGISFTLGYFELSA